MINRRSTIYTLIILALVAGLLTGRAFFFTIAYIFGGLLLLAYAWAWSAVHWIVITRKTRARRAQVGRYLEEMFAVTNTALIPKLWLELRDQSDLPGHRASHVVPAIRARNSYRWYVKTPCLVRGEFRLGPMVVASGDPFGLFLTPRRVGVTSRVIVLPATVPISRFHLPLGVLTGGEAERKFTHAITTNAAGVREYAHGDSYNRVHWKSTARRDKLMVKEFELNPLVDIWLFVDFSSASLFEAGSVQRSSSGNVIPASAAIPASTEEYAVVCGASLASHFITSQRALGFTAYTPNRTILQAERGERQLMRILQTLAVAHSQSHYSLAQMLSLETNHFARGTTLVIITSSTEPAWIAEAQVLSRRGIRPVCVYIDPASFGAAVNTDNVRTALQLARIPHIQVKYGDELQTTLEQRPI